MIFTSQMSYWDSVADKKSFSHPLRLDWLGAHLKPPAQNARILDYGCGYGRTLAGLSRAGYRKIIGLDFSMGMLARCRSEQAGTPLLQTDGRNLPLRSSSIDAVVLFAVLTCIPGSDQQRSLIVEVRRVLKPGGLLYVSDLLVNNDERNRERYERHAESYACYGVFELPEGVVVRHHQREWIAHLTDSFKRLEYEEIEVTTMNGNPSSAFQYLGRTTS